MKALKCLVVFAVVAGLCATAVAVQPPQSSMKAAYVNPQELDLPHDLSFGPPAYFSDTCPADDVGMMVSGGIPYDVWNIINGSTCASSNAFELDVADNCGYSSGGRDEIFQFTVDYNGVWDIDTICVGWDTSIQVREETGGGCPGDFVGCDGDSGHPYCGMYESLLYTFLEAGKTYYVIIDGWSPGTCGDFGLWMALDTPCCEDDSDCNDGLFCNGVETCPDPCGVAGGVGECLLGTDPCAYYEVCDEDADVCVAPDPCVSWLGGVDSNYFFPYGNATPGIWLLDDIELEQACTGDPVMLDHYEFDILGRDINGVDPPDVGDPYFVDLALWTVEEFACMPLAQIAGTQCSQSGQLQPGGTVQDVLGCTAAGPVELPNNSGDFNRCEIDFFIGYVGATLGSGFSIAGGPQIIGGLAGDDDFGVSVFFLEDFPGAGTFSASWFGDEAGTPADFANAVVCTFQDGICCEALDVCSVTKEADCTGDWTPCKFWDIPTCEDPDGDGMFTICGDNCPGVANPGQEDCDAGTTPEGDACETNPDYADDDGDGTCNIDDECPNDPNKILEGICGCGVSDVDTDGDGVADCNDPCPNDPDKVDPGQCGCGVPDTDDDGDGVANCNDECPGVDDAIFAPGCAGAIPTVSEWGLVILALLLLVGAKVYFGRRAAMS